ncbi:MAG: hypothetical protein KDH09_16315, partial [Chrysiogenetes bacterium]|nr:hypothetical protein [Chrysiogenetes bacterium]
MSEAIGALLLEQIGSHRFPGAAVSVRHGDAPWQQWCAGRTGYENIDGPWEEVTPATLYDLA